MGKTTRIVLSKKTGRGNSLYQYDYGQVVQFVGVSLPETYEVHFSNTDVQGTAKVQLGHADGVMIPDEYLLSGDPIYIWVFLHDAETDGRTEYKAYIPVVKRPITDETPITPVQQDVITETIAALNNALEKAQEAEEAWEGMTAESTTLPAGSEATAEYQDGVLTLGIPQGIQGEQGIRGEQGIQGIQGEKGNKGDKGDKGDTGDTGATPAFMIGTVETVEPGQSAQATITGTAEHPVLNLKIPRGLTGGAIYS